jgi:ribosomal protein L37AE/L43A
MTPEELEYRWNIFETYDPKCPKCNQVHPRKKTRGVWVVTNDKVRTNDGVVDCKPCEVKGMAVTLEHALRGMKRKDDE